MIVTDAGEFAGLPVHILLVHFTAILVPVAAVATLLSVAWPAARRRLGILTPAVALLALVAVPVTMAAGQWLLVRVYSTALIRVHALLGPTLLPWAIAVAVVAVAQWLWFSFGRSRASRTIRAVAFTVLVCAAVVTSAGATATVVLIGESGSRAVWQGSFSELPR